MGVAGITVFTGKLAAAVRIDAPLKRHALGVALVDITPRGDFKIVYLGFGFQALAGRRHFRDSNQPGHNRIFALSSPSVKRLASGKSGVHLKSK